MKKRNIYLTQFNNATERNLIPLAIGLLYSYVKQNKVIDDSFNLNIEILRDEPDNLVNKYEDPFLLAYSNYFWNYHYTLHIAKLAKEKFPNTIIVFGGPSVPVAKDEVEEFFKEYPFVDVVVAGEGELVFNDILETLATNKLLNNVDGLSLNIDGKILYKQKREPIDNFLTFPSPFLDGTFDTLLEKYSKDITGVVWESNRGCPFSCSFCYWGGPEKRITDFSEDRVYKELDWIAKNKINYIFGADANFGIRDRDEDIARYIANLNIKTGYPKFFVINWNKNSTDKIFNIVDALNESDVSFMLTVSVQSFHSPTLEAVKRKNIKMEHFHNILKEAHKRNFNTYTEIILGLPLETYETFKKGIGTVLVPNLNYHFNLYPCVLIPGTEMGDKDYIKKYDIQSRSCEINLAKTATIDNSFKEYEDIIVGTSTMDNKDWQKSYVIGFFVKSLYGFRLVYHVFNYLRDIYKIDLIEIFDFILDTKGNGKYTKLNECIEILYTLSSSILSDGKETIKLDNVETSLYPEMAILITVLNDKEEFYNDLYNCIIEYLKSNNYSMLPIDLKELINYQNLIIPSYKGQEKEELLFSSNTIKEYFSIKNKAIFIDEFYTNNIDEFLANHIYGGMIFKLNTIKEDIC